MLYVEHDSYYEFYLVGLGYQRLYPFEAGLVQRVPKKMNEMKSDLLNSIASRGDDL